jgi:hypothetical protein
MKKQACIFAVILGIELVLGFDLNACKTEEGGPGNPFPGIYIGTGNANGDTLVVTGDSWTSTQLGIGTYAYAGARATLSQGGAVIGSAVLSDKNLTIPITTGNDAGNYLYTKNK